VQCPGKVPVICQKMTSKPTAHYLPLLQVLVFVAYKLVCLLYPIEQATPQTVIGCLWLRFVLLFFYLDVCNDDVIKLLREKIISNVFVLK